MKKILTAYLFLYNSLTTQKCFSEFRRRYEVSVVKVLDKILTLRCRIANNNGLLSMWNTCLESYTCPPAIRTKILRDGVHLSPKQVRLGIESEIEELTNRIIKQKAELRRLRPNLGKLTLPDQIRFCKFSIEVVEKTKKRIHQKTEAIARLCTSWYEDIFPKDVDKHIHNTSKISLTRLQKEALCRGLDFCVAPKKVDKTDVAIEFEKYVHQFTDLVIHDKTDLGWFKAKLVDTAHEITSSKIAKCPLPKAHKDALDSLKKDKSIRILKPDKGNGVVVMSDKDYIDKMNNILKDQSKFVVDANQNRSMETTEKEINDILEYLHYHSYISSQTLKKIQPKGDVMPRLRGAPKIHKDGCPLRPVLNMRNSSTYKISRWLNEILRPVEEKTCCYQIKDSFSLYRRLQTLT